MKRIILVLLTLTWAVPLLSQEYVNIPDANFLAALIEKGYDKNGDGQISSAEATAIDDLDVSEKAISDLTGIEKFVNLNRLDCSYNELTSLDISDNTVLKVMNCEHNNLSILDVSENSALTHLLCQTNQLTSIDVSANIALRALYCGRNNITTLNIENNTALEYLVCPEMQLTDLDVSNNNELKELWCEKNHLTTLDLSGKKLQYLRCDHNNLNNLDLSYNTELSKLFCSYNQLIHIDLIDCNSLTIFACEFNSLKTLDLSMNIKLTDLFCSGNLLPFLDLSNNFELELLVIGYMPTLYEVCVTEHFFKVYVPTFKCNECPNVYFTTECTIGLEKDQLNSKPIHPNPTNSTFTLDLETPIQGELEIHSLNGQLIYRRPISSTSEQIDMSNYTKGIYFVTVRSDAWVRTEKVVKY